MTEHNVKEISIKVFEAQYVNHMPSWQLVAIKKMAVNTAIALSHEGLACKQGTDTKQSWCSATTLVGVLTRGSTDKLYKFAHAPNGDIMVACYARTRDGEES